MGEFCAKNVALASLSYLLFDTPKVARMCYGCAPFERVHCDE